MYSGKFIGTVFSYILIIENGDFPLENCFEKNDKIKGISVYKSCVPQGVQLFLLADCTIVFII